MNEYRRANQEVLAGRVGFALTGEDRGEGIRVGANTCIDPRTSLRGPVLIGSNCRLEAGVTVEPYTVIGDNVVVEEGASLKQTVVWKGAVIGRRAAARRAVIGEGVVLEENSAVYEGAAVGDGSRVGAFSLVKPEVKIWPSKEVEPYTTVRENLVWGSRASPGLFASCGVGGYLHRDLTPARVSEVAQAWAGVLEPGSRVGLSRAPGAGAELLALAVLAGLMAGGLQVLDLGEVLLPAHRYLVREERLAGGVHVRRDPREQGRFWLVFMDGRGLPPSTGQRRKVEAGYQQGDFRRLGEDQIRRPETRADAEARYLAYLREVLGARGRRGYPAGREHLVVQSPSPRVRALVEGLADLLPWDLALTADRGLLRQEVRSRRAVGVSICDEGERLWLWEPGGMPLARARLELLLAQVALADPELEVLALPVTGPEAARELARARGVEVRLVGSDWRVQAEAAWREPGGGRQVRMLGDALYTLSSLAACLAAEGRTLARAIADLPPVWRAGRDVPCPWWAKGKVLRRLAEAEDPGRVELVEGLKVYRPEGWALLLPDADEPLYHVYGEAGSLAAAETLCRQYGEMIDRLARPPGAAEEV
ncbi:MAG: hypothetical protein QHH27_06625 [Clostridia bacterium]|nr:hypothetical protein [Clostridia bacterium]